MQGNFACYCRMLMFSKINVRKRAKITPFFKIFLQAYHQSVKPGPTCLQIFSARGTDRQRVLFVCFPI